MTFIKSLRLGCLVGAACFYMSNANAAPVFRFHLPSEPVSLAPNQMSSADVSLLFHNLYRGLYSYSNNAGLRPEGAENCTWKNSKTLLCTLSQKAKWSDGTLVTAEDYVRAWRKLLSPDAKSIGSELLENIAGAKDILKGSKKVTELGVTAEASNKLQIKFDREDPDFLYKTALVILVPIKAEMFPTRNKASELITNGPYKIESWKIGSRLRLSPNTNFQTATASTRPAVEVLFIEEDLTALNLYESGELSFMRRLPTQFFAKYKSRPDFHGIGVARFDYIGFGAELANRPFLRKALSLSADFAELKKIYSAVGMPGCPALHEKLFDRVPCLKFNLDEAKKAFEISRKTEKLPNRIQLAYSKLGGDVIQQGMEWFQGQWKKNLGLTIDLQPMEQGVYLSTLRSQPPAIFRKGVGLDRPTCLAALETFTQGGPENFLKINDPSFEKIVATLTAAKADREKRKLCREGVESLLSSTRLIPLGRFEYMMLAKPQFSGWTINELHQLDLTRLRTSQ